MGCLQTMQTGAIKASLRQVDWTVTTPSVTAVPDGPGEQRQGTHAACAATLSTEAGRGTTGYYMDVQPAESLALFGVVRQRARGRPFLARIYPFG